MQCPSCGVENAEGMAFCTECGTRLQQSCPSCGFENTAQAKFCGKCGAALLAAAEKLPAIKNRTRKAATSARKATRAAASSPTARCRSAVTEAERRQLTVMFCDLVGSTPLAEQLDPEDLRQVILAYQQTCAEQIQRFDGYLARYVGDGVLVYFGYPRAHEDDAPRAIRAGLGIVAELPSLNTRLQQTVGVLYKSPLQVRIGIHTGLVVVGDMGGGDYRDPMAIVGETPNIAARLQGLAEPDTVVISEATYRLAQGLFEYHPLGPQALKGVSTPVPVYRVLRESEAQSRFEVAVMTGLTPLVGREEELGLLRRRWEQAKAGEGQVVLLSGEAGIGKSRLVQELKEQAIAAGATRIEFRCSPYHQNSAFYSIIDHLQRLLQFAPHDTAPVKLAKLQQILTQYRFPEPDTLPLLAALLSLPHPEGFAPLALSPQKQKQKTQDALVAWIVEEAEKAAVCCVWEDLHWADPSTLEVLTLFLDQVPTTRLLVVLTCRPEFSSPWPSRAYLTTLTLTRLPCTQAAEMVAKMTGGKALPAEVVHQVVSKTDGVPLFVEELIKMVLESGLVAAVGDHYELSASLPPLAIPATLHDSLMARLDRLASVREIAQLGATVGREFSYELLHAVSPLDEGSLQQGLRQLVEVELIYQRGLPPQATYLFKHALIQDTAYQALLKSTRQQYHRQIAQVLTDRFPETVETQPELVAHHYTEASLIEQALPHWQRAGERAIRRSAYVEAVAHLTRGLELLKPLADTPKHVQHELTLQLALGDALVAVKGYTAPDVEKTVLRARELCQQLGETPQLILVLFRLFLFYFIRGDLQTTRELAEQLMRLAQSVQEQYLLAGAHAALGGTLYYLGELTAARTHLEEALALYNPRQYPRSTFHTADPRVDRLSYVAHILWHLGYPDQALQRSQESLALAEGLSHPLSLTYALVRAALLGSFCREGPLAQERAEVGITLSTEQGFPFWVAFGTIMRGWAVAEQGQVEEGMAQMQRGLATLRAAGADGGQPYFLGLLAEAWGKRGNHEEGLILLTEALVVVEKNEERRHEAELYRLKGELTLQQSRVRGAESEVQKEVEACFHKALEIARKQQAKSLELRAVMSLSQLWQKQGKKDEARQMLAEIYGWFTEGFDTKDLQEAKALLAELAEGR